MTSPNGSTPDVSQPCDEWYALIMAADAAGRSAARDMADRCSTLQLALSGRVDVHVEPCVSPVADWLCSTGRATVTETGSGVLVPVTLTAADLGSASAMASTRSSLLVAHAYAVAYSALLGDEAGVATEIRIVADSIPPDPSTRRTRSDIPVPPLQAS